MHEKKKKVVSGEYPPKQKRTNSLCLNTVNLVDWGISKKD